MLAKKFIASTVVLAASAALSGCAFWSSSDAPKPADLGPNKVELPVRQVWTAQVGALKDLSLTVGIKGNQVFLAAADGTLVSLDAQSGRESWRVKLPQALSAGVGSDGQTTAVVTKGNQLVVVEGGRELWRKPLTAAAYTAPLVAGERVFVLAADRSLSAFDGKTGAKLWTQTRTGEPLVLSQPSVLQAYGNTLLAGMSGRLVAYSPDNGAVLWEAPLASPRGTNDVERLVDLLERTSRVGDVVCARAYQAAVGCVNVARGQTLWTQPARGSVGIDGDADLLAGAESNGTVQAWNRADGARLWSVDRFQYRQLTAPLLLGRSIVVADSTGLVHMLSKKDGSHLNRLETDKTGVSVAPVVAADTLVVVTRGGNVYGFRPE